jgi:hypothetical protein
MTSAGHRSAGTFIQYDHGLPLLAIQAIFILKFSLKMTNGFA